MNSRTEHLTIWVYEGVWGVLATWFRVPRNPPTLPTQNGAAIECFRPADGFLRYLKLQFWIALVLIDVAILGGWLAIAVASPLAGALLAAPAFFIAVVPDILAYVAIHLRYDTTWYVMSDRSLRIRRGIWVLHETTITFENVQNVMVSQGPLQRWFGIADVTVLTAGGGGGSAHGEAGGQGSNAHRGLMEGVANAAWIRDLLLSKVRHSRATGLGDEHTAVLAQSGGWTSQHLAALREIRDAVQVLK